MTQNNRLPGTKRIERGTLYGDLDDLAPCLLVAQPGSEKRCRDGEPACGLFSFGEPLPGLGQVIVQRGLVLPLALCSDPALRQTLTDFVRRLGSPDFTGESPEERYREINDWLAARGLGCLQLAGRPMGSWLHFVLGREVFAAILRHCRYVTAVEDGPGRPTRVLTHAPFHWDSHGALLEWSLMERADRRQVEVFSLYLVPDGARLRSMFTGRGRCALLEPSAYWERFTAPRPVLPVVHPKIRIDTPGDGWTLLQLVMGEASAEVRLSPVFDPLPALLDWLQAIAARDLPVGLDVNEEGSTARLVAHAFGEKHLLVAVLDRGSEELRAVQAVNGEAFLAAFRHELADFLENRLDTGGWGCGVDAQAQSDYRQRLLRHHFLTDGNGQQGSSR